MIFNKFLQAGKGFLQCRGFKKKPELRLRYGSDKKKRLGFWEFLQGFLVATGIWQEILENRKQKFL